MRAAKNMLILILITIFALVPAGCESNTVSNLIISDRQYTQTEELNNAKQPEQLVAGKDIYASVNFIESPKGMEYTAKWFINGNEIKTDTQEMPTDRKAVIVFSLEKDKVTAGTLKFEVSYKGEILASRELVITGE